MLSWLVFLDIYLNCLKFKMIMNNILHNMFFLKFREIKVNLNQRVQNYGRLDCLCQKSKFTISHTRPLSLFENFFYNFSVWILKGSSINDVKQLLTPFPLSHFWVLSSQNHCWVNVTSFMCDPQSSILW